MDEADHSLSKKGLSTGTVGLWGATAIGVSCVAPAYTLTAALGPTVAEVGRQVPALIIVGFLPMLLVAFGYRELNRAMPDSGTSFTWGARAFGPWVGWMTGWGLCAATILVLSNCAGVAVDFFYLLIAQLAGKPDIAQLAQNPVINVATCLVFMFVSTALACRDMKSNQLVQYVFVGFQITVLVLFAGTALWRVKQGGGYDPQPIEWSWFNPAATPSFAAFMAGLSLSIFIFWGWDVTLTMNEETRGSRHTPGRAAAATVLIVVFLYLLVSVALIAFAGVGNEGVGLSNPAIQSNVFSALAHPVLGPLGLLMSIAVLSSSAASIQSTIVGPARTLLAMGHYGALPPAFGRISPRFLTPAYATVASGLVASAFYAVMRFVSEDVLWDTITALGMMICFYYSLTAAAAVWYFRRQWFRSFHNFVFQLLFPLVGGAILAALFCTTLKDSMAPDYGSGSHVGGVGLVFVLGVGVLGLGVVVMLWQAFRRPAFFRGETIAQAASDGGEESLAL
jgi:amino acid transporter